MNLFLILVEVVLVHLELGVPVYVAGVPILIDKFIKDIQG